MLPMRLLDAVTPLLFRGGLDLPGAVAFAAVAPGRAHVAGDWIRTLRLGMLDHPVVGGAGNARYPALRRYRAAGGVGPYHACLRANTGAACSETSTSTSFSYPGTPLRDAAAVLQLYTGSRCAEKRLLPKSPPMATNEGRRARGASHYRSEKPAQRVSGRG